MAKLNLLVKIALSQFEKVLIFNEETQSIVKSDDSSTYTTDIVGFGVVGKMISEEQTDPIAAALEFLNKSTESEILKFVEADLDTVVRYNLIAGLLGPEEIAAGTH